MSGIIELDQPSRVVVPHVELDNFREDGQVFIDFEENESIYNAFYNLIFLNLSKINGLWLNHMVKSRLNIPPDLYNDMLEDQEKEVNDALEMWLDYTDGNTFDDVMMQKIAFVLTLISDDEEINLLKKFDRLPSVKDYRSEFNANKRKKNRKMKEVLNMMVQGPEPEELSQGEESEYYEDMKPGFESAAIKKMEADRMLKARKVAKKKEELAESKEGRDVKLSASDDQIKDFMRRLRSKVLDEGKGINYPNTNTHILQTELVAKINKWFRESGYKGTEYKPRKNPQKRTYGPKTAEVYLGRVRDQFDYHPELSLELMSVIERDLKI